MKLGTIHRLLPFAIIASALLAACDAQTEQASDLGAKRCPTLIAKSMIDEKCAIALAQQEIAKREGATAESYKRFRTTYDEETKSWIVWAIYQPETPGGHVFVSIGRNGQILKYAVGE